MTLIIFVTQYLLFFSEQSIFVSPLYSSRATKEDHCIPKDGGDTERHRSYKNNGYSMFGQNKREFKKQF